MEYIPSDCNTFEKPFLPVWRTMLDGIHSIGLHYIWVTISTIWHRSGHHGGLMLDSCKQSLIVKLHVVMIKHHVSKFRIVFYKRQQNQLKIVFFCQITSGVCLGFKSIWFNEGHTDLLPYGLTLTALFRFSFGKVLGSSHTMHQNIHSSRLWRSLDGSV